MWQTWPDEESGMWRIVRWVNGEKEFALGTWPTLKLAQLMCDRLNEAAAKRRHKAPCSSHKRASFRHTACSADKASQI